MGWSTVSDLFRRWNHKSYGVDQESVRRKACKVFIIHAMLFMYGEVDYSNPPNKSLRMRLQDEQNHHIQRHLLAVEGVISSWKASHGNPSSLRVAARTFRDDA